MSKQVLIRRLPLLAALCAMPLMAQTTLDTPEQKAGYSIGANIGYNLANQGVQEDIDVDALLAGIRDAINGNLQLTDEQIIATLQSFAQEQQQKADAALAEMEQVGRDFLAENASADGVKTTASGLQYMVLSEGDANAAMPAATDTVEVHYHGTLVDGTVFDSSVDKGQPVSFAVNGVIPGWVEGLQLMKVGDKFRFFIPPELGYGDQAIGPLPPNSVLIFDVELLDIK